MLREWAIDRERERVSIVSLWCVEHLHIPVGCFDSLIAIRSTWNVFHVLNILSYKTHGNDMIWVKEERTLRSKSITIIIIERITRHTTVIWLCVWCAIAYTPVWNNCTIRNDSIRYCRFSSVATFDRLATVT